MRNSFGKFCRGTMRSAESNFEGSAVPEARKEGRPSLMADGARNAERPIPAQWLACPKSIWRLIEGRPFPKRQSAARASEVGSPAADFCRIMPARGGGAVPAGAILKTGERNGNGPAEARRSRRQSRVAFARCIPRSREVTGRGSRGQPPPACVRVRARLSAALCVQPRLPWNLPAACTRGSFVAGRALAGGEKSLGKLRGSGDGWVHGWRGIFGWLAGWLSLRRYDMVWRLELL